MTKTSKSNNHPNFQKYMKEIINHPNYKGLPITYKEDGSPVWVAPKKANNTIGLERVAWADKKAKDLEFENSSKKYADTMFAIHPTKIKVCQWCGESMDLHYIYPTKNTVKFFEKNFDYTYNKYDSIYDIVQKLPQHEKAIINYLIKKANLSYEKNIPNINQVIKDAECACRMSGKGIFSPGAMSNFPDRFDGFHSYSLCCRKSKDKGRHDDNMATYNKDRRAYEYWSDGNIAAANQLMRDPIIFNGMSADHIGPISLGFIHDPLYLQPLSSSDNSAKRERLYKEDLEKLIKKEEETKISPASHFARDIWNFIKRDYLSESSEFSLDWYRDILKQNMINFMESLWFLLNTKEKNKIEQFLSYNYFSKKYELYFQFKYEFNSDGTIKKQTHRNMTDSSKDEFNRFVRISFESIENFHSKSSENRNMKTQLTENDYSKLLEIKNAIVNSTTSNEEIFKQWLEYLTDMQQNLLNNWEQK